MKTNDWKTTIGPHIVAVLIFIALSYMYLLPLVQGKVLAQHDYTQAMGQQHEITEYVKNTGDQTLWTNSMFSGMPTVQIWLEYPTNLIGLGLKYIRAIFVNETDLLFLLMAGFYLLLFPLTKNVWLSTIGAIAFAFGSFNTISIEAGHLNKVLAMAFIAPILGGILLAYRGKWLAGALLLCFFLAMQLRSNHLQITYYTMIAGGIIVVFYDIYYLLQKNYTLFARASGALLVGALLAVGTAAPQIWGTYEYSKATIRGGQSELSNVKVEDKKGGLTKEYAFSWSQGIGETFTVLIPNLMGGGSSGNYEGTESHKNLTVLLMQNRYPAEEAKKAANQLAGSELYWGSQPFTSGPIYFGAIVCFLFVLGMFVIKHPVKWALLAVAVIAVFLSWGKNFAALNYFIFDYLPMYNKFRTPSMILTITNLVFVLVGFLALKEIWGSKDKLWLVKQLKMAGAVTLAVVVIAGLGSTLFLDFDAPSDYIVTTTGQAADGYLQANPDMTLDKLKAQNLVVDAYSKQKSYVDLPTKMEDRMGLARKDAMRSLFFILLAIGVLWAWITEKTKRQYLVLGLGVLILTDLWSVSKRYLNDDDFVSKVEYDNMFIPTEADRAILNDKDLSYRVLDMTGSPFNNAAPSYWHKSVGGYHAAKLRTYQELIEHQITKDMGTLGQEINKGSVPENIPVLNMLNTRYFVFGKEASKVVRNPNAAGNAWFVENVLTVNNADDELFGLSNIDPRKTALVRNTFDDQLAGFNPSPDPNGSVTLTEYKPDHLTYRFKSSNKELVVFSEIYYPDGKSWKAFIDGQPVEHLRANYVLRALLVPAGEHTIEFKFEPVYYSTGGIIALISSLLALAGLGVFIYLQWKGKQPEVLTK